MTQSGSRVFIGLSEIAGQFSSLEAALRASGVDATFHNLSPDVFAYRSGSPKGQGLLRVLHSAPDGTIGHRLWQLALLGNRVLRRLRAAALFPSALVRYDAFILGGHETFLGGADLWILRRLRKPVVIIFTGTDHRPPFLSGKGVRLYRRTRSMVRASRRLSHGVRRAERWASAVVALPTSAQFHVRPFVNFLVVGIPMSGGPQPRASPPDGKQPVRVLHCPTDPIGKGSDRIRAAVNQVRIRGVEIHYRQLVGRPNSEVLAALEWCDFIVDELYSDTPMAKFGVEAAHFGRPAVVGSYAVDWYCEALKALPPSKLCHPDHIEEAIYELATNPELRLRLGAEARAFVTTMWAPRQVAERLMTLISGKVPREWIVDPAALTYVHGWGIPESILVGNLGRLLRTTDLPYLGIPAGSTIERNLLTLVDKAAGPGAEEAA